MPHDDALRAEALEQGVLVTGHPTQFFYYSHYYFYRLVGGGVSYGPSTAGAVNAGILTTAPKTGTTQAATGGNAA